MKVIIFFLFVWVLANSTNTTYSIPVSSDCSDKLSLSLQNLSAELQYFGTPQQNKNNLYKRVTICQQYLSDLKNQMSQYNNVIIGGNNKVNGSKNIIVGSYNTITGNNNFVFVEQYTGSANGDLLLQQWRVDLSKANLILVDPTLSISFLNQQQNRDYLTLMTNNRISQGYGSNIDSSNIFTFIREQDSLTSSITGSNTQQINSSVIPSRVSTNSVGSTSNAGGYSQNSQNTGSSWSSGDSSQSQNNYGQTLNNGGYVSTVGSTSNAGGYSQNNQNAGSSWSNGPSSQSQNNKGQTYGAYVQNVPTTTTTIITTSSGSQIPNTTTSSTQYSYAGSSSSGPNFSSISSSPIPNSIAQLNSLFGYSFGNPQLSIPTQIQFTNYNTGNAPGANVANQVISSINQGTLIPYGNLRIN